MAKLPDLFVNAVTTFDGKALAKGQKQIGGFEKSVKNLAKTFGVTFGAAAMLSYGKNAVKAFAENEKSAKRLETVLKNLGLAFDTDKIEKNLDMISAKFGYQGEVLREAFQGLITATGSTTKAQDLLNLSLDVAAGSGQDLLTVNRDLAAVYVGNTKGLRKYNLGLAQSELKTLGFDDAITKLTATFAGAATAELDTYAGKMRVLQEAAGNAQETIGGALIDAFMKLAGDTTMDDLTDSVDNLADSLAAVIELTGAVAAPFVGLARLFDNASDAYVKLLYKATGTAFMGDKRDRQYGGAAADKYRAIEEAANAKARAKAEAEAAKREKERLALLKKQALLEKNKLSLSKAAAVFDTTRISLAAALKATYDKETRLRLEALIAIEEDNGDLALRKIGELAALQKNADLAKLAGIKEISDATLLSINTQLLNELTAIDKSKMAESDKEIAREEAFKKYNAAITAAGQLASAEQYSERVQIQLTEIARLAAISRTTSASNTATLLRESAELSMIDRVAKAQKAADEARLKSLQDYIAQLNRMPTVGGLGGGGTGGAGGGGTGGGGTGGTGGAGGGGGTGGTGGAGALGGKTAFELEQEAALKKFFEAELARRAAEKAAADAAAKAAAEALQGVGRGITEIGLVGEKIDFIPKAEATAANIAAILEYADAATARANAIATLLESSNMRDMEILTAQALGNPQYGFQSFQSAEAKALVATGNGSVGGGIGAFDRDINITVNTGVGDPEAIARAIEDLLNQSGYRGTTTNRGSGNYLVS
jgi:hypothetical protein